MADQLKEGKAALVACLPPATAREAEAYFSPRGTVEAARDLRDTLFRGAARKLLAVSRGGRTGLVGVLAGIWKCGMPPETCGTRCSGELSGSCCR